MQKTLAALRSTAMAAWVRKRFNGLQCKHNLTTTWLVTACLFCKILLRGFMPKEKGPTTEAALALQAREPSESCYDERKLLTASTKDLLQWSEQRTSGSSHAAQCWQKVHTRPDRAGYKPGLLSYPLGLHCDDFHLVVQVCILLDI